MKIMLLVIAMLLASMADQTLSPAEREHACSGTRELAGSVSSRPPTVFRRSVELQASSGPLVDCRMRRAQSA